MPTTTTDWGQGNQVHSPIYQFVFERSADRPAWSHIRRGARESWRQLVGRRELLPDGGLLRVQWSARQILRIRIPFCARRTSVSGAIRSKEAERGNILGAPACSRLWMN